MYLWFDDTLENVRIDSVYADAEKGGWEATLVTLQDTDALSKWQSVEIFLRFFAQGWDEEYRTALVGHALPLGFDWDFLRADSRFSVATSHRFLEGMSVQGIGFADRSVVPAPGPGEDYNDHQILNMRLGHIVRHILMEHCNICTATNPEGWVDCSDIDVTNSTRVNRYNFHATDNAWAALQDVARNEFYYLYFSRDNAVHYVPHPMYVTPLPAPVMEFTGLFCAGRPVVHVRAEKKVSQVVLRAVDEDGTTYTSKYPPSPADEGRPMEVGRIRVEAAAGQDRLDVLAVRLYDFEKRDYTVEWPAPGWSGFFFELMDRVSVTYTGTSANGVHVDWDEKKFWIHKIQMSPGPAYTGQTVFTLEAEEPEEDLYYFA